MLADKYHAFKLSFDFPASSRNKLYESLFSIKLARMINIFSHTFVIFAGGVTDHYAAFYPLLRSWKPSTT